MDRIIIIGGGQAGSQAAQTLRRKGFEGSLTIFGDEPHLPYQRPPLSKGLLKGETRESQLYFRQADFYEKQSIDLKLGHRVDRIDRTNSEIILSDGTREGYDRLILATGTRPRTLPTPGADLKGVLLLRGLDDALALKQALENVRRVVVVGGGYIGLEAASACRQMDKDVVVLERMDRVLARVTCPEVSQFYQDMHARRGVDIRCNTGLAEIEGKNGEVSGVVLEDGSRLPADLVLVGIGVLPNQELAQQADLPCADGILSDLNGQTEDPDIYAIGDCARHPVRDGGDPVRLESVHNAIFQANCTASHLLGDSPPAFEAPWFWSDQYEIKLQTAGLFNDFDQTIVRGEPDAEKFSILYFREGQFIAVDAINDAPSFLAAKNLLSQGVPVTVEQFDDPATTLRDIFQAHKKQKATP